ncbi:ceramide glucosyltransferase-B-like [Paramacrobiotus metropolitanus]|uniref:ceramide glucosyltransferase-B-like n=1 Tax=Paramacrobiotus metropolitanus TaxID=2943436 RepID=UPI0024461295|nr:ceramide glucosyltransferase-B-like [Paramacrobiotus metropolitanus]XP_055334470.1 ceramide glucosyltransferase-B-like [Paramacrobiotus metropolitanus]
MYHSGSLIDVVGLVLSIIITVFWIGVWHLHLIGIMYGKWRLHRSSAFQIPGRPAKPVRLKSSSAKVGHNAVGSFSGSSLLDASDNSQNRTDSAKRDPSQIPAQHSATSHTIVQVEVAGQEKENIYTLFSGDLLPGVSILKPLVGIDQYLMHNLESFFVMSYPKFELLFCVTDESDPAVMIVQSLMKKYPCVDARIFIGGEHVGVNPKINNMMPGYRASKYELVLVSDSGISMRDDTLLDMVYTMLKPEMDRDQPESRLRRLWNWLRNRGPSHGVGLVHQMPFCLDRDELGFPACLEKVYFGTAHARIYLSADCVGINCPTGMSALMRKNLLENKGGMGAFGQYLAEDYFFAKAMTDQGWVVCISSQPAWQNSAVCHLAHFQGRLERWAKLRFAMVPVATLLEPFQECLLLGLIASFAVSFLFALSALGVFLVHVITWFLLDWILLNVVQNGRLKYSKLDFIISWIFREATCFLMFAKAILNPRIQWKSGFYRLKWGGHAELVKTPMEEVYGTPVVVSSDDLVPKSAVQFSDSEHTSYVRDRLLLSQQRDRAETFCNEKDIDLLQIRDSPDYSSSDMLSPPSTKSSINRSRHIRSRSLPQRNNIFSFFSNISNRLTRSGYGDGSIRSTCDDMMTNQFSFRSATDRYV